MYDYWPIFIRLLFAMFAGSIIGLERSYHGRPAGLRTHALVCTSSSLLMLLTVYQLELLTNMPVEILRIDPTRMAQGIMTGIGFLGAGVIMREKLTIRGLTTAASIWMTASIGIIIGMGFYIPAIIATLLTLAVLSLFGWSERRMSSRRYGRLMVRYKRSDGLSRAELNEIIQQHGIKSYSTSYHLEDEGKVFEYQMTIETKDPDSFHHLAESLNNVEKIREFSIIPTSD